MLLRRENGTIPDPLQTGGTHTVVITDNKGVEGRTSIEIPDRTLDVNPQDRPPADCGNGERPQLRGRQPGRQLGGG